MTFCATRVLVNIGGGARKMKGSRMDVKSSFAGQPNSVKSVFVPVWDPFVRASHWLVAAAILVDWITDEPRWMHVWLGYLVAALVILRVAWGFVGPEHARFADFVTGPRAVIHYLAGLIRLKSQRYLGHSPAGGVMVIALLIMVFATGYGDRQLGAGRGRGPSRHGRRQGRATAARSRSTASAPSDQAGA
jgi:hypothetical protein